MNTMNYTEFRANLAAALDKVNNDHSPILITRSAGKPAVLVSLDDYYSMETTSYLMASPSNAARLRRSIADVNTGNVIDQGLIEE